jgi:hypothetical protein
MSEELVRKKFQKSFHCGSDFLHVVEEMLNKCDTVHPKSKLGCSYRYWYQQMGTAYRHCGGGL